jgi:hypothetical protein
MLLDAKGKPTRVGMKIDEKGKKVRIAKTTGAVLGRSALPKEAKDSKEAQEAKETKKAKSTIKETSSSSSKSSDSSPSPKKSPFWKKMGFGSDALPHSEDPTGHDVPGVENAPKPGPTQSQSRAGSRGS